MLIHGSDKNDQNKAVEENQFPHLTKIAQNPVVNEALGLTENDQLKTESKKGSMREKLGDHSEEITFKHNDVIFKSNGFKLCSPAIKQVFGYLLLELSEYLPPKGITEEEAAKHSVYMLDINKYCEARGLKDKKSAKQAVITALDNLSTYTFEYPYTHFVKAQNGRSYQRQCIAKGGILTLVRARDIEAKGSESGYFLEGKCKIVFSTPFVEYMANDGRNYMPFYRNLLTINTKLNPFSFPIGYKLQYHRFRNNKSPTQNIISINSLLSISGINLNSIHINQSIIEPFERDLDNLQTLGIIASWEYVNAKGQKIKEKNLCFSNLDKWRDLYIKFLMKDYPNLPAAPHKKTRKKRSNKTSKKEAKTATK